MKGLIAFAVLVAAALLFVGQKFGDVHPLSPGPDAAATDASAAAPHSHVVRGTAEPTVQYAGEGIAIDRDHSGQFHLDAAVNGTRTRFLVDTGADTVALSVTDAQAAGIEVNPNGFVPILRTASGQGYGTLVTLDRLEIGETQFRNVGAVVVKDLGVSLLGQSVLARMGRVELKGDRMVIEPQ
ncbi:MAG: TIGR02281 family clan AA aspartic protease [Sphingomonadales bacterium]|nr:TIGR02281 family clan AA aspartic protease [Sphingomonadales bacterium]MBU3992138.1 TIGR02281 family clan AA aspartic protease [Alphaproteobacteria bacterium]